MGFALQNIRRRTEGGAAWAAPRPMARAQMAAPVATAAAPLTWFDSAKTAAQQAAVAPQSDGRKLLDGSWLTNALATLTGVTGSGAGSDTGGYVGSGSGDGYSAAYVPMWSPGSYQAGGLTLTAGVPVQGADINAGVGSGIFSEADYETRLTATEKAMGLDPSKKYAYANFDNVTGNAGKDKVQALYQLGTDGSAKPISARNDYVSSSWVGMGRDFVKAVALMAAGCAAIAYAAPAAASAGTSEAAASAAATTANGSALTIEGAQSAGFGTGLSLDGFGSGLGTAISDVGANAGGSIFGLGIGTVTPTLTFAAQGIDIGSALAATAPTATSPAHVADSIAQAAPSTAPAAVSTLPATLPTLGQLASGAGTLAGLVGKGAALVGALTGTHPAQRTTTTTAPAQAGAPLLLLAIGAAVFFSAKG